MDSPESNNNSYRFFNNFRMSCLPTRTRTTVPTTWTPPSWTPHPRISLSRWSLTKTRKTRTRARHHSSRHSRHRSSKPHSRRKSPRVAATVTDSSSVLNRLFALDVPRRIHSRRRSSRHFRWPSSRSCCSPTHAGKTCSARRGSRSQRWKKNCPTPFMFCRPGIYLSFSVWTILVSLQSNVFKTLFGVIYVKISLTLFKVWFYIYAHQIILLHSLLRLA